VFCSAFSIKNFASKILEREQEQSVVYGSIDFGKSVVTHPKYMDLLQRAGSQLKILPHTVINDKNDEIVLCSSVECKGSHPLNLQ
jgi:protein TIF31